MLAIQNTCGGSCCRDGPEGDTAFAHAASNHNFESNNGPGPWLVGRLTEFARDGALNYGAGEHDAFPCPLQPAPRDFTNRAAQLATANLREVLARWGSPVGSLVIHRHARARRTTQMTILAAIIVTWSRV